MTRGMTHSEGYIGCAMLKPQILFDYPISANSIEPRFKDLYNEILTRVFSGKPIDDAALSCDCRKESWWPGVVEVSDLPIKAISPARAKYHADALMEQFQRNRLKDWHVSAAQMIETLPPSEAVAQLESGLVGIISGESEPSYSTLDHATTKMLADDKFTERVLISDPVLDAHWFLDRSALHIIGGRTSMGKTAFALWLTAQMLQTGKRVFYFTIEMNSSAVLRRLFRILANGIEDAFDETVRRCRLLPLLISDRPGMTIEDIALMTRAAEMRSARPDCVVVDYLQLIKSRERFQSRERQVSQMAADFKEMAKRLKCPVICLAQINRETEGAADPRPKLSNLRESGDIENHADSVVLIHRPEYNAHQRWKTVKEQDRGKAELLIAKQRSHAVANLGAYFDAASGLWTGWQKIQAQSSIATGRMFTPTWPNKEDPNG